MRIVPTILCSALAFGLLAGAGLYGFFAAHEARLSWFDPAPARKAAGSYSVRIVRDPYGLPHIYGRRDADAAFGLGYAQAQDDFEGLQRAFLAVRGSLALIDGRSAMDADASAQLLGFAREAEVRYETLSPAVRSLIEAYASGVNLYATQNHHRALPGALPVRPSHVVALFMQRLAYASGLQTRLAALQAGDPQAAPAFNSPFSDGIAVAVAPARSMDSATRLLISARGPFAGPDAWRGARIVTDEGWNFTGASLPGTPFLLQGANDALGWGVTANGSRFADVYALDIDPENDNRYRFGDGWQTLQTRRVRFDVKLWGPLRWTFTRTLLSSLHGPVFRNATGTFAVRYAGMGDLRGLEAFYRLNKARDFPEFENILQLDAVPALTFAYADETGRIAAYHGGAYPARGQESVSDDDLPGGDPTTLWRTYLPFAATPKLIAPRSGVIVIGGSPFEMTHDPYNLNAADFPVSLGLEAASSDRAKRAHALFLAPPRLAGGDLEKFAFDQCYAADSTIALRIKDMAAQNYAGDPVLEEAGQILRRYDLCTDEKNRGAALAVLAALPLVDPRVAQGERPSQTQALQDASETLLRRFGRLDPEWGEVNRLLWGESDNPIGGGPETMRAAEAGVALDREGRFAAKGGAVFTFLASWRRGDFSVSSLNVVGDAVTRGHKAAELFAKAELRPVTLDERATYAQAVRIETPRVSAPVRKKANNKTFPPP